MNIVKNESIKVALEQGYVIYMKDSGVEKRYYKLNSKTKELEWSDNNQEWNISNLTLEDLMKYEFVKTDIKK